MASPRPDNATVPDVPLEGIPGTYFDQAYGEMIVCALPSCFDRNNDANARSATCRDTIATNPFPRVDPAIPDFIARVNKLAYDYLLFTHHNGSVFTVTPATTYPERNETIVSQFDSFEAVFTREGMTFMGNAWGAGPGVQGWDPEAVGVEDAAEVWFQKAEDAPGSK